MFFLNDKQQGIVQKALSAAMDRTGKKKTKAVKNSAALIFMAHDFMNSQKSPFREKPAFFVKENNDITLDK